MTNKPVKITMIAAAAKNLTIGKSGDLPWRLPDDMKFFMDTTTGHPVIMGRKSYEALPPKFRPLPNRTNIIVTRNQDYQANEAVVLTDIQSAIKYAETIEVEEIFITGGGEIYKLGLDHATHIYLTEINAEVEGDAHFPEFDRSEWQEVWRKHHPKDERHGFDFDFVLYARNEEK